ncbi:hypothetical protein [Nostoc sp.]|uniref:hypothetical protein n=1 Tax=Nostoc sp. TaxID=1180 RepID=UPI002FF775A0
MKKLVFGVGFILALALPIKNTLSQPAEISASRQVYEVILDFPQGFKIRVGSYDRATVTAFFDAETGESLSTDIEAPASAFHSNYDPVIAPRK